MSYQIETILTDGRKVRAVFGSKDFSLIEKIKFDEYSEYEDLLYDRYKLPNEELSSLKLMENILNGDTEKDYRHLIREGEKEKFAKSSLGAVYGYLHRDICLHYGKIINRHSDHRPMLTSTLDVFENRNRAFFKIPYSLDFPHSFCVLYEELDDYKKQYSDKLKEVLPENNELQIDIEYIFSEARKEKLDILFCNY